MDTSHQLKPDEWLSKLFQYEVFRFDIHGPERIDDYESFELLKPVLGKKPVFVFSKIPVNATGTTIRLEKIGFHVVDTNITFEKTDLRSTQQPKDQVDIRFAVPQDEEPVRQIAQNNFAKSRFHIDPFIPAGLANMIKAEWAAGFFHNSRGDAMIIAEIGDRVVGFLLLIFTGNRLVIDLIAVEREFRRKGIAAKMIGFAQSQLSKFSRLQVGTQIGNTPSIRFYGKQGYHFVDAQYVLHFHNID